MRRLRERAEVRIFTGLFGDGLALSRSADILIGAAGSSAWFGGVVWLLSWQQLEGPCET